MANTQEQRRQQIGEKNTAARRASGVAMREDLRNLAEPERQNLKLPPVAKRGSIVSARGIGIWSEPAGGRGIASPLTETIDTRIYGEEVCVIPPAGYFAYCARPVTKLTFTDADGADVVVNLELENYAAG